MINGNSLSVIGKIECLIGKPYRLPTIVYRLRILRLGQQIIGITQRLCSKGWQFGDNGRPIAQWSRIRAVRDDDLGTIPR
jgi:hypothetical protein